MDGVSKTSLMGLLNAVQKKIQNGIMSSLCKEHAKGYLSSFKMKKIEEASKTV